MEGNSETGKILAMASLMEEFEAILDIAIDQKLNKRLGPISKPEEAKEMSKTKPGQDDPVDIIIRNLKPAILNCLPKTAYVKIEDLAEDIEQIEEALNTEEYSRKGML